MNVNRPPDEFTENENPYAPPHEGVEMETRIPSWDEKSGGFLVEFSQINRYNFIVKFLLEFVYMSSAIVTIGFAIVSSLYFSILFDDFLSGILQSYVLVTVFILLMILMLSLLLWWFISPIVRLNFVYKWIVSGLDSKLPEGVEPFVVQIDYAPLRRGSVSTKTQLNELGWRRWPISPEDVGYLFFEGEAIRFEGDCSRFVLHSDALVRFDFSNLNILSISLLETEQHPFESLEISVRENQSFLKDSRRIKELFERLENWYAYHE